MPPGTPEPDPALASYLASHAAACPRCGYELKGSSGGSCPECGQAIALAVIAPGRSGWRWWPLVLLMAWVLAASLMNTARNASMAYYESRMFGGLAPTRVPMWGTSRTLPPAPPAFSLTAISALTQFNLCWWCAIAALAFAQLWRIRARAMGGASNAAREHSVRQWCVLTFALYAGYHACMFGWWAFTAVR